MIILILAAIVFYILGLSFLLFPPLVKILAFAAILGYLFHSVYAPKHNRTRLWQGFFLGIIGVVITIAL